MLIKYEEALNYLKKKNDKFAKLLTFIKNTGVDVNAIYI